MSAIPNLFVPGKMASDVLDFSLDFKNFLVKNEVITLATVTGSPSGLSIATPTIAKSIVTAFIGGGTNGISYIVSFAITTNQFRTETRSAILNVQSL